MEITMQGLIGLAVFVLPFVVLVVVANWGQGTQQNVVRRYVG